MNGGGHTNGPLNKLFQPESKVLINIQLVSRDRNHAIPLEAIPLDTIRLSLWDLRTKYLVAIPSLPQMYQFLTRERFPLKSQYEPSTPLTAVIHEKEMICEVIEVTEDDQFGIVLFIDERNTSSVVGSIHAQGEESLRILRDKICNQLEILKSTDFFFLDRNAWPVSQCDETTRMIVSLVHQDSCVWIILKETLENRVSSASLLASQLPDSTLQVLLSAASSSGLRQARMSSRDSVATLHRMSSQESINSFRRQPKTRRRFIEEVYSGPEIDCSSTKHQRFAHNDDTDSDASMKLSSLGRDRTGAKREILISYVRAETSHITLYIKEQLVKMGYTVYLDVDEIKIGSDWQDSLNDAVSQCDIFVPLVTSRYGETQWTNREVKLADVLDKIILPVNFLPFENWPPRCLAIQFATTQFIPWKTDLVQASEIDLKKEAERVCKEIGTKCRILLNKRPATPAIAGGQPPQPLTMRRSMMMRYGTLVPTTGMISIKEESGIKEVVVCAHTAQKTFAKEIKEFLEKNNFKVWCSTSLLDRMALTRSTKGKNVTATGSGLETQLLTMSHPQSVHSGSAAGPDGVFSSQLPLHRTYSVEVDEQTKQRSLAFQQKADRAGAIIVLLSSVFSNCKNCNKQLFYCEQRKTIIPIECEKFQHPGWLKLLLGRIKSETSDEKNLFKILLTRLSDAFDPNTRYIETPIETQDARVLHAATVAAKELPSNKLLVYVAGSTNFHSKLTKPICELLGKELAEIPEVCLVTGGFSGVGQVMAEKFSANCEENSACDRLWHLIPHRDDKDFSKVSTQMEDGKFKKASSGTSIFCGESVREREDIASHVAHVCVLLEGGPGAAHEAEQFAWLDKVVLPVPCTGGAAAGGVPGKFKVPERVFQAPPGVPILLWEKLLSTAKSDQPSECNELSALCPSAESCAEAVANIVANVASSDYARSVRSNNAGSGGKKIRKKSLS